VELAGGDGITLPKPTTGAHQWTDDATPQPLKSPRAIGETSLLWVKAPASPARAGLRAALRAVLARPLREHRSSGTKQQHSTLLHHPAPACLVVIHRLKSAFPFEPGDTACAARLRDALVSLEGSTAERSREHTE
jgi:hypothetical protein